MTWIQSLSSRLRSLFRPAIALGSTLISLLAAEIVVRVVLPQGVAIPWQDEINGITAPRPNVRGRHAIPRTFDVTVSFNSQRLRGRKEVSLEAAPRVVRISALGDSFAFGYGVDDDATYPAQLESFFQGLSRTDCCYPAVEVINAANGGTGTAEQALWYDTWVKQFRPKLVLLNVTENDPDDDLRRNLFYTDSGGKVLPRSISEIQAADRPLRFIREAVNRLPGYAWLSQHSQLVGLLRNASSAAISRRRSATFAATADPPTESERSRYQIVCMPTLKGEVQWLNARARDAGSRLAVVFLPTHESVYHAPAAQARGTIWKSDAIVASLEEICLRENIPFVDLTPKIRERAKGIPYRIYYDGLDSHPNARGYQIIAENVATFLIESGLLQSWRP